MHLPEFKELFDLCRDMISIIDRDYKFQAANEACSQYTGVGQGDILGASVEDVVGKSVFKSQIKDVLESCFAGETVSHEGWFVFSAMGSRYVSTRYSPHKNEHGEIVGVFLISRDMTEQKCLEQEVDRRRKRLDTIVSSINIGLLLINPDLTIDWVNEQIRRDFLGLEPVGIPCYEFFNNPECSCTHCEVRKTFATGESYQIERFDSKRGRWYSSISEAVRNDDGEVVQVLLRVTEITERKQAEKALHAREAELSGIFRAARVGICELRNRTFHQINDYFCDMVGYPRESIVGENSRFLYESDEEYERVGRQVYSNMQAKSTQSVEMRWVCGDGRYLDLLASVTPLHGDDLTRGVTLVAMDITDRKVAEAAIRESEQRFKKIFEDVHMIAVQGYDEERKVVYWNPASENLYGYSAEEAIGRKLEDLIIPDFMREGVRQGIKAWMTDGIVIPAGELELVRKDGSSVPVYSSHVMQQTASGEKFMYCVDVDLSEIKHIHSQLVKAKEKAEAASQAKSAFLANMSHEIRTPLNGIMGMFSLLKSAGLDEQYDEYAEAGLESARRLDRLLTDILDLSRVEAGRLGIQSEVFDLPKMVNQVDDFFRYTSLNAEEMLNCYVDGSVPQYVVGDAARLQQVLTNLVGNGLKFTSSGSVSLDVTVMPGFKSGQCRVLFTVSDTGIGIPDEFLGSLFESFTQVSTGFNRQYEGAGLGLSICRRLVDLMGGNMALSSEEGVGTEVYIVLPFKISKTEPHGILLQKVDSHASVCRHVLLVEDERVNSVVARRLLEKMGCTVSCVGNGEQALAKIQGEHFDIVFMDVQMPILDGVETTVAIRAGRAGESNRNMPIIAMTAYAMSGDRERFLAAGMDDYIAKPIEYDDLVEVLERVRLM